MRGSSTDQLSILGAADESKQWTNRIGNHGIGTAENTLWTTSHNLEKQISIIFQTSLHRL